jgi:hypothetical protein
MRVQLRVSVLLLTGGLGLPPNRKQAEIAAEKGKSRDPAANHKQKKLEAEAGVGCGLGINSAGSAIICRRHDRYWTDVWDSDHDGP